MTEGAKLSNFGPQFNRLLEDARRGCFDIVLCKSQSRFTREMELVEKYIHGLFVCLLYTSPIPTTLGTVPEAGSWSCRMTADGSACVCPHCSFVFCPANCF